MANNSPKIPQKVCPTGAGHAPRFCPAFAPFLPRSFSRGAKQGHVIEIKHKNTLPRAGQKGGANLLTYPFAPHLSPPRGEVVGQEVGANENQLTEGRLK